MLKRKKTYQIFLCFDIKFTFAKEYMMLKKNIKTQLINNCDGKL